MKDTPWWWEEAAPAAAEETPPARTRVAVIGGGYAGLSAALTLRRLGHEVTVLDAERIGWGASSRNGGMVSGGLKVAGTDLARRFGTVRAADITSACTASLPFLEELIAREAIDCDYVRCGRFVAAWSGRHYDALSRQADTVAARTGLPTRMVPRAAQRSMLGSDRYHGGMQADATGSLHPAKFARGLAQAARHAGAVLVDDTRVLNIRPNQAGFALSTSKGPIQADTVLTATNGYALGPGGQTPMPWFARRLVPLASYIIATAELPGATIDRLFPGRRMISETRRVLNYFRPSPDGRRVLWGGRASFSAVSARQAAPALRQTMAAVFPELADTELTHAWTGNVAFTFDGLPHIGVRDGVYFAGGCQGSGVAMASWLGHNVALKMAGAANAAFALDGLDFPTRPFYRGDPAWILPVIGNYYRLRDSIDRARG